MPPFLSSLAVYADRRIVAIFFLGFSSGLPLALTLGTLAIWLSRSGVDKTTIGLLAAVTLPYTLKFVWAPLIDRLPLPPLTRLFGRRRGWTLATQIALMAAIVAMASTDPIASPGLMAIFALLVSFCSASQDVVIDSYRIELLEERKLGAGAASVVYGYRVGMLASGAGALYLAEGMDWGSVYLVMAALVLVGVVTILLSSEPRTNEAEIAAHQARVGSAQRWASDFSPQGAAAIAWFYGAVVAPFVEFMKRPQWLLVLVFIIFYKLGDSLAGVMTGPFMVELGFSNAEIANVGKIYGFGATLLGLFVGGWLISARGIWTSLWVCGFLQMGSNLIFAIQAEVGYDTAMLAVTVGIENLAGGMGTAAFVAYLSSLCNIAYTAMQYALLSSLMAFGRTVLSTPAGWFADMMDWTPFFILTTVAAVPGMLLLLWLTLVRRQEQKDTREASGAD
jgi:PAT family beta-lactamase induction signal transducer AmpG